MQTTWQIKPETGFLISPQAPKSLKGYLDDEAAESLASLGDSLAELLAQGKIRQNLDNLPVYEVAHLEDWQALERAFQLYAYFASAYVFATGASPASRIPAGIAVPLVKLAQKLERPPILAYASYTLANWEQIDPHGVIELENLRLLQKFIHKPDAAWFTLIHVAIEANAAPAIQAIPELERAANLGDDGALIASLEKIQLALSAMLKTLQRMPEGCHPHVYYHEVRPYIFSFDGVSYEGVAEFRNEAQFFRGETGAQSTIIPALVKALGLVHEASGLTQHLEIMRDYMPKPHREFLQAINHQPLQDYLNAHKHNALLRDAYNASLSQLLAFRQVHLRFAASYIANQSPESLGTGGTEFMAWLQQLISETEAQFIKP